MIPNEFFSWEAWFIDSLIKITIVLAIALCADYWLSRRRHFVLVSSLWRMAIAGILVLPMASLIVPSQPGWISLPRSGEERLVASNRESDRQTPISVALPGLNPQFSNFEDSNIPRGGQQTLSQPTPSFFNPIESKNNLAQSDGAAQPELISALSEKHLNNWLKGRDWGFWLINLLIAGWVLYSSRLLFSFWHSRRLQEEAQTLNDPMLVSHFVKLQSEIGIKRRVPLLHHNDLNVPLVTGICSPSVILPTDLIPDDPLQKTQCSRVSFAAVAIHELTHIRRRDPFWNLLLQIAAAIYWFHPLAWLMQSRVGINREKVCDDYCIFTLGNCQSYVDTLIAMASRLTEKPANGLHLAAIRKPKLAIRIAALIQSNGHQQFELPLSARSGLALACIVAIAITASQSIFGATTAKNSVVATEIVHLAEKQDGTKSQPDEAEQEGTTKTPTPPSSTKPQTADQAPSPIRASNDKTNRTDISSVKDRHQQLYRTDNSVSWIFGRVVDSDGAPVNNAKTNVLLIANGSRNVLSGSTDSWGEFKIRYSWPERADTRAFVVFKNGFTVHASRLTNDVMPEQKIRMLPAIKTIIDVFDENGQPADVKHVQFESWTNEQLQKISLIKPDYVPLANKVRLLANRAERIKNHAREIDRLNDPEIGRLNMRRISDLLLKRTADINNLPVSIKENRIRFDFLPEEYGFTARILTEDGRELMIYRTSIDQRHTDWFDRKDRNHLIAKLTPTAELSGRISYSDGTPLPGARVIAESWHKDLEAHPEQLTVYSNPATTTDKNGNFTFKKMSAGKLLINYFEPKMKRWLSADVERLDPDEQISLDCVIKPLVEVVGRVIDQKGDPVEGTGIGFFGMRPNTFSDANGKYSMFVPENESDRSLRNIFFRIPDGYVKFQQPFVRITKDILESGSIPDFALEEAQDLEGQFLDLARSVKFDIKVYALWKQKTDERTTSILQTHAQADDNWEFVLKNVSKNEPLYLYAESERGDSVGPVKIEPGRKPRLRLDDTPSVRVSGRITDKDGMPVENYELRLRCGIFVDDWGRRSGRPIGLAIPDRITAKTDATGEFAFEKLIGRNLSYQVTGKFDVNPRWFHPNEKDDSSSKSFYRDFVRITFPKQPDNSRFTKRHSVKMIREVR